MGVLLNKSLGLAVLLMLAVTSGSMGAAPEADDVTAARDAFQRWWYQATDKFPERRLVLALSAIPPEEREADDWFWLSQASHRGYEIEVESPDPRLRPDQALGREAVLRVYLEQGRGEEAAEVLREGVSKGAGDAALMLSGAMRAKRVPGATDAEALRLLRFAAEAFPPAQVEYAAYLATRPGGDPDGLSTRYFEQVLESGNHKTSQAAKLRVARIYLHGHYGQRIDPERAVSILESLAERGNAQAKYELAVLKLIGLGTERDVDGARRLMKEARDDGITDAEVFVQWFNSGDEPRGQ